jgi:hypothetical protein
VSAEDSERPWMITLSWWYTARLSHPTFSPQTTSGFSRWVCLNFEPQQSSAAPDVLHLVLLAVLHTTAILQLGKSPFNSLKNCGKYTYQFAATGVFDKIEWNWISLTQFSKADSGCWLNHTWLFSRGHIISPFDSCFTSKLIELESVTWRWHTFKSYLSVFSEVILFPLLTPVSLQNWNNLSLSLDSDPASWTSNSTRLLD